MVKLIFNSVPGCIKKLFKFDFVKPADTLKVCLSLSLPVIDFTPLSLTIVFWVHLRERFRTKSAWEVHPCRSPRAHTRCLQSCTVNVLFDPQLNIWVIKSLGKNWRERSETKDGGWEWHKWEEEVVKNKDREKKELLRKERDGVCYYTLLSFNSFVLSKMFFLSFTLHFSLYHLISWTSCSLICFTFDLVFLQHQIFLSYSFSTCFTFFFFPPSYPLITFLRFLYQMLFWITL